MEDDKGGENEYRVRIECDYFDIYIYCTKWRNGDFTVTAYRDRYNKIKTCSI